MRHPPATTVLRCFVWMLMASIAAGSACTPAHPVEAPWVPAAREPSAGAGSGSATGIKSETAAPDPALLERMHRNLTVITRMRDALVFGDLATSSSMARDFANGLSAATEDDAASSFGSLIQHVRAVGHARSPADGARAIAGLARACGDCHEARAAAVHLPDIGQPPSGTDTKTLMQQHRWASERMWEGLIGPSSERWVRGTAVFGMLPRCHVIVDLQPATNDLCTRVQRLAHHAHGESTTGAQAEIYGRLLATCADCHE